jgi:tetrapyrrole methylase family protein/MazG family protein
MTSTEPAVNELLSTIKTLRSPVGCPWDRRQTMTSLIKHLHEEFNELIDAIKNQDFPNICEESGDLLYLILMISEISREKGEFHFPDVVRLVNKKLIRRHPHVFDDRISKSENDLTKQWNQIKSEEKKKNLFDTDLPKL